MYLKNRKKYLYDIEQSQELQEIWENYRKKNLYVKNLKWEEITKILHFIFNAIEV